MTDGEICLVAALMIHFLVFVVLFLLIEKPVGRIEIFRTNIRFSVFVILYFLGTQNKNHRIDLKLNRH